MKKIIFFHPNNDYTGSTRVLCDIIEADYPNCEVVVVTKNINNNGFLSDNKRIMIIRVFFPIINIGLIRFILPIFSNFHLFILALFYGCRFDVFYINTIMPSSAALAGKIMGKTIIYHIHEKINSNSFIIRVKEYVFNHTKATRVFVSEYTKNQYPESQYTSIIRYNKLSKSFVSKINIISAEDRSLKNIIMLCSLSKAKGIFAFIELAKQMTEYNFSLVISADQKKIDDFIDIPISDNLTIYPNQQDIHPFLQYSDLLLNLSNPLLVVEAFGLTIIEAMAYGIPAIVPDVGGPVEIVIDGYNGYCVDVTNLQELQIKIKYILDREKYSIFSFNALERVKKFEYS